MIEVRIRPERIEIFGHAGYADPGKDIVCAGVTALTQTLIQSIDDLTDDLTDDEIEYRISPGKAEIEYRNLSREIKNSGGFLFRWHLFDCGRISGICESEVRI